MGFWINYKKQLQDSSLKQNGYFELSETLQNKIDEYQSNLSFEKFCKFFTWDEFKEFITKTTFLTLVKYKGVEYGIEISKEQSYFYSQGTTTQKGFINNYKTPQLLLENVRIDGKSLHELWKDLYTI